MFQNVDKKTPKNAEKFNCELCDFKCFKASDWERHVFTLKHQNVDKMLTNVPAGVKKNATPKNFVCFCGKSYSHRQSLNVHKKKCIYKNENTTNENAIEPDFNKDDLIKYLIKENVEFKDLLLEQNKLIMKVCEKDSHSINNSQINSNNKTFNLNVFLNETCKDAMNITDFVNSLQIQMSDLENVGKLGFVEGISNIIVKNLKDLDVTQRPIHCTDKKREVLYVKDENKWEKEGEPNQILRKAIKNVAHKNTKMLKAFREKHPDCGKSESKYADQYNKLIIEVMGGKGDNDLEKQDKIIKNIAKEVVITKML